MRKSGKLTSRAKRKGALFFRLRLVFDRWQRF